MPELPEVEVVRAGLEKWISGRVLGRVEVLHPRAVRRHEAGPGDLVARLSGRTVTAVRRRGKYLWLPLDAPDVLVTHLGMSGQLLVVAPDTPPGPHLRVRLPFADGRDELRFVDQRTFGGMFVAEAAAVADTPPAEIAHIATDPLDGDFDEDAVFRRLRKRRTNIKRALLDQSFISGVGNIYADEALWRARLHWARGTDGLTRAEVHRVVAGVRDVMLAALRAGGTSFDSLYVNVNGESGYFDRALCVYGREGEPCDRCGTPIKREPFMNRSAYTCPSCQPRPRRARP
ncbi:MAG: bifunctional DNA-formamidopyrimidine glycosylase/DNA-(apurinic or apyrimidinic site) lyase [Streptosporangiales bacterium]|nr:bifunctional DNA-formamidopyrimidine glycosylase/DNA-(apurinic or apyrimidinic site) lyase [Streptosporangiales bacterium]